MQDRICDSGDGDNRPAGPAFVALALSAASLMVGGYWNELATPISESILADIAVRAIAAGAGLVFFFWALPRFGGERVEFSEDTSIAWRQVIVLAAAGILISAVVERGLGDFAIKRYGAAPECAPHLRCPVAPITDIVDFE